MAINASERSGDDDEEWKEERGKLQKEYNGKGEERKEKKSKNDTLWVRRWSLFI